jgi:hypothetical protein
MCHERDSLRKAAQMKSRTSRRLAISLIVFALCALALPLASSSQLASPSARNLPVSSKLKKQLRAVFVASHKQTKAARIRGPLSDKALHYGRYRGREWAIADFSIPVFKTQDQPEVFSRKIGGRWLDRGDTGGSICSSQIPLPVIMQLNTPCGDNPVHAPYTQLALALAAHWGHFG